MTWKSHLFCFYGVWGLLVGLLVTIIGAGFVYPTKHNRCTQLHRGAHASIRVITAWCVCVCRATLSDTVERAYQDLILEDCTASEVGKDQRHDRHWCRPAELTVLNNKRRVVKEARGEPVVDADHNQRAEEQHKLNSTEAHLQRASFVQKDSNEGQGGSHS